MAGRKYSRRCWVRRSASNAATRAISARLELISVSGRAELTTDGADDQIDKLAKKYLGQDKYPWRSADEQRVSVRIRPEQVDATGFDS